MANHGPELIMVSMGWSWPIWITRRLTNDAAKWWLTILTICRLLWLIINIIDHYQYVDYYWSLSLIIINDALMMPYWSLTSVRSYLSVKLEKWSVKGSAALSTHSQYWVPKIATANAWLWITVAAGPSKAGLPISFFEEACWLDPLHLKLWGCHISKLPTLQWCTSV